MLHSFYALFVAPWLAFVSAMPAAPQRSPEVTLVRVDKSEHSLELFAGDAVIKSYRVALGPGGLGPKRYEGDLTTPTGRYLLRGRFALYHQFINVTYPNAEDRARHAELKKRGEIPEGRGVGFGIGLHGVGRAELAGVHKQSDWTAGCIAVDDAEIDEISALVKDGTPIEIRD
jgi:murein L,D-transpeptidase YafK